MSDSSRSIARLCLSSCVFSGLKWAIFCVNAVKRCSAARMRSENDRTVVDGIVPVPIEVLLMPLLCSVVAVAAVEVPEAEFEREAAANVVIFFLCFFVLAVFLSEGWGRGGGSCELLVVRGRGRFRQSIARQGAMRRGSG